MERPTLAEPGFAWRGHRQHVGQLAADRERRHGLERGVERPEVGCGPDRRRAHGFTDAAIDVEYGHAIHLAVAALCEGEPVGVAGVRHRHAVHRAHLRGGLGPVAHRRVAAHVACDALQAFLGDLRADVVQDHPSRHLGRARRDQHGQDPAERRAEENHLLDAGIGQQPREVAHVGARVVVQEVRVVLRAAAAAQVGAQHAPGLLDPQRGALEVAAVARQAVHTDHDVRVVRLAPVGIGQTMEAVRPETEEVLLGHGHGRCGLLAMRRCSIRSGILYHQVKYMSRQLARRPSAPIIPFPEENP